MKFQLLENFASGGDKNLIGVLRCLLSPSYKYENYMSLNMQVISYTLIERARSKEI